MQQRSKPGMNERLAWRYLSHALGEKKEAPWRIAARLTHTDLFRVEPEESTRTLPAVVVAKQALDADTAKPFVLTGPADARTREAFELIDLLSMPSLSVAQDLGLPLAAMVTRICSSPSVRNFAQRFELAVADRKLIEILKAAAQLDEALEADWDWQIATLSSAVELGVTGMVDRQLDRLMAFDPSEVASQEVLSVRFTAAIASVSTSRPRDVNVDSVRHALAHLPWKPTALLEWEADIWPQAESWISTNSPGLWFHLWLLALRNPSRLSEPTRLLIWDRIAQLLTSDETDVFLSRYECLLRYFFYRTEASVPNARADFAIWSASFLAETLSNALSGIKKDPLQERLERSLGSSTTLWRATGASAPYSVLRSAFYAFGTQWRAAIQASVSYWSEPYKGGLLPDKVKEPLAALVKKASLLTVSEATQKSIGTEHAQIMDGLTAVQAGWSMILDPNLVVPWIDANQQYSTQFADPQTVRKRMEEPFGIDEDVEGAVALSVWASMVVRDEISMDTVADLLTSRKWCDFVEPTLPTMQLELVVDALLKTRWTGRETIRVELAHWAARQCLNELAHPERREFYFWATAFLSLHGGTTSAIAKLMHEDKDNALSEQRAQLVGVFMSMLRSAAPAWVQGRIRSALAIVAG